tara:strand:- start:293 stop:697 length:405 start_codon:yes stop_codon:yes gene_type:complete
MRNIVFIIGVFIISLVLFNSGVKADSLYVGQWSHHFKKTDEITREKHPLVLYNHDKSGAMFGYWRNSFDRDTFAVARSFVKVDTAYGMFGVRGGLATGYDIPVFGALYYEVGWLSFNLVPSEVISVGLKFPLSG